MIMAGSGVTITYTELDRRSNQLVHALRDAGLTLDDTVAVVAENRLEWAELIWAAQRSGLCLAPVQRHLRADDLAAVLAEAGARAVVTTPVHADAVRAALDQLPGVTVRLCIGGAPGFDDYATTIDPYPDGPVSDERLGSRMMFSSGTTGRPKGIRHPRLDVHPADAPPHLGGYTELFGFDADTVYLSPAPTYHTAPFRFVLAVQQLGGTVVCQESFDPEGALAAIERYRVTHAQFVPTMLTRMVRLPALARASFDLSSLQVAITGAAPCPAELKRQIMEWWGPVLHELYGASESYGNCHIGPRDGIDRPGSVGRALVGRIHILDPDDADGPDLQVGEVGQIWFEGTQPFHYRGDEDKNRMARNDRGWSTVGDLGRTDADGYLYLVGRRDHVIISGGVNVHPQQAEERLAEHPAVADVAVIGVPDDDLGQRVHALVVPSLDAVAGHELGAALLGFARAGLPRPMCPRSIEFVNTLPRGENGKLYKRALNSATR
ncbi:AMP-binding protein [Pseudonocardia sp. K10HN5]|uniref:AMP-binding protein n=2 Tax=Pseudonocardia acidicola TaxID=2724939 RepID=A0ABX1SAS1_9PSEU|nr:AMP-binding protein [Pseudonocardia acidicola]